MKRYQDRRKRCRRSLRLKEQALTEYIHRHLLLAWSPEQISNRMRLDYPDDNSMRIAFSSIYRWLREDLLEQSALLRQKLRHYGHRHHEKRGQFHGVRELKERCRDALKRKQVGHWEVDTIISCHSQVKECLLNMVDRKSRYCLLVLLRNKVKKEVMRGFTLMLSGLPVKTITSDRGKEFACYQDAETFFNAPFYFTRPYSPWQKPSVENSNGLIRQFFPNGTDFNEVDEQSVNQAMNMLNNRPRKCLGWKTPSEVLSDCCCT
jgi:IS30 family transposase